MQYSSPVKRAVKYLQQGLKDNWPTGSYLPSMRILARDAKVGYNNMQVAVRTLAQKGLLTVERKNGIFAGKRPQRFTAAPRSLARWEQVKESLHKDITLGVFEDQACLPRVRQLQKQYLVSMPTLRKALKALIKEGALVRDKKRYGIVRLLRPFRFTSILLISPGTSIRQLRMYSGKFRDFYAALESRCVRSNINLA
jgi:DNA-binding GntR family transcriptional regulator